MIDTRQLKAIICGLFVSVTTLTDWYLNATLRSHPMSEQELSNWQHFLDPPMRVISPPDLPNNWVLAVAFAASMFLIGYVSPKAIPGLYHFLRASAGDAYLKSILLAAFLMGSCVATFFFKYAYMLPTVCKIYMAAATALYVSVVTYLPLRLPYCIYSKWRQGRQAQLMSEE